MKIHSKLLMMWRILHTLLVVVVISLPFILAPRMGMLLFETDVATTGYTLFGLVMNFFVCVGLFIVYLVGEKLIEWLKKTEAVLKIKRAVIYWFKWVTTQDIGDKFVENI
jgi:hypothetical protein